MAPINLSAPSSPPKMLDMEEALSGPDAWQHLNEYDEKLIALARRAKKAMDEGLSPEDFEKCRLLIEAVKLSRKIIRLAITQYQ